ncbi:MAG: GNAT family N-acetyltransferase [Chloroflexi bacterium]|nr:GNAT family N-acetyltransferase [Chloroflexota bacterium]
MEVREISGSGQTAWDELVASSRQGNIFVMHELQSVWCETDPSLHLVRLGCYDEHGKLIGGQSIFRRKVLGLRIPTTLSIFYAGTPILPSVVQDDDLQQRAVLSALAQYSIRSFPFLKIEFHPTLKDVRPYLKEGWHAYPEYTYVWEISDPDAILTNIQHRKRKYVRKAREQFLFTSETGDAIVADFLRLYRETVKKFGWHPGDVWIKILRKRIEWLQTKNAVRLYTCRTKTGELLSAILCILSHINQTVYSMYIGYDHSADSREFPPALDCYIAQDLSGEFSYVDFSEAPQSNLYGYKDSLGTKSTPYWKLETPNARRWTKYYELLGKIRRTILK